MARGKLLVAVGVAALLAGLMATFPARVAYQWFAPPQLSLSGISGTVWRGAAAQGSAAGLFLGDLSWRFRPLSLLRLSLGYEIAARLPGGFIEGNVAVRPGGAVRFTNLAAAVPLASMRTAFPLEGIDANLTLRFDRLVLDDGFPTAMDGRVDVSGLVLRALSPRPLGDYRAELQTNDDGISGTVEDLSGVLDLRGNVTLAGNRAYSLIGQVAANANAPAAVTEQLRFLGSPDSQGRREFRFEGSF